MPTPIAPEVLRQGTHYTLTQDAETYRITKRSDPRITYVYSRADVTSRRGSLAYFDYLERAEENPLAPLRRD